MWPRSSHALAPLTKLTYIKNKFKWKKVKQYAFNTIDLIVAHDNLLTYPDSNETFKIHTYASAFQLGAVISHKGKPFNFYSIKITDTQKRYTVTEKEPLSITETLNDFRTILICNKSRIYIDH